jgi:hypothetical protein
MPIQTEMSGNKVRAHPTKSATALVQSQPPPAAPPLQLPVGEMPVSPKDRFAAFRKQIPEALLIYEPKPSRALFGNPVVNECGAAGLLGVSQELLKKWRQRSFGPNYIQYGKNGPIRYELNELTEFREVHAVQVRSKK